MEAFWCYFHNISMIGSLKLSMQRHSSSPFISSGLKFCFLVRCPLTVYTVLIKSRKLKSLNRPKHVTKMLRSNILWKACETSLQEVKVAQMKKQKRKIVDSSSILHNCEYLFNWSWIYFPKRLLLLFRRVHALPVKLPGVGTDKALSFSNHEKNSGFMLLLRKHNYTGYASFLEVNFSLNFRGRSFRSACVLKYIIFF